MLQLTGAIVEDATAKLPHSGLAAARIRPDGALVTSCGWDGRVRLFDWQRLPTRLAVLPHHDGSAYCMDYGPDDVTASVLGCKGVLATGGKDGKVVVASMYPC